MSVHSPARELQSRLEVATGLDWLAADGQDHQLPKHPLSGMALMSAVAIVGWFAIAKLALAVI